MSLNTESVIKLLNSHYSQLENANSALEKPEASQDPHYLARIEGQLSVVFEQISAIHKAIDLSTKLDKGNEKLIEALTRAEKKVSNIKKILIEKHQKLNLAGRVAQQLLGSIAHHYVEERESKKIADEEEDKKLTALAKSPQMVGVRSGYKTGLTHDQMEQLVRKTAEVVGASSLKDGETRIVEVAGHLGHLLVTRMPDKSFSTILAPRLGRELMALEHMLGSGDFGITYKGISLREDERLALKILKPLLSPAKIQELRNQGKEVDEEEITAAKSFREAGIKGILNAYDKSQYIERHGGLTGVAGIKFHFATEWSCTTEQVDLPGGILAVAPMGKCNLEEMKKGMSLKAKLELARSLSRHWHFLSDIICSMEISRVTISF